jgi:8-oxo-dGTP pyrophosphatase MutT (NUDIX family)
MRWTVHGETPLYQDEWLDIRLADVELPDGRRFGHRLIRTPPGAGCVVVRDGQVLLLWRHRFITGSWSWEIPFGKIDPGEDLAHAAARETEEETGWRPGPLTPLLKVEPTAGCRTRCITCTWPMGRSGSGRLRTGTSPAGLIGWT